VKKVKRAKEEREIEKAPVNGKSQPLRDKELKKIESALKARRKDITMTIRVNSEDIEKIRNKAKKMGVKYQSYISEIIHQVAQ